MRQKSAFTITSMRCFQNPDLEAPHQNVSKMSNKSLSKNADITVIICVQNASKMCSFKRVSAVDYPKIEAICRLCGPKTVCGASRSGFWKHRIVFWRRTTDKVLPFQDNPLRWRQVQNLWRDHIYAVLPESRSGSTTSKYIKNVSKTRIPKIRQKSAYDSSRFLAQCGALFLSPVLTSIAQ